MWVGCNRRRNRRLITYDSHTYPGIQLSSIRAQSNTHCFVIHICTADAFEYGAISAIPASDVDSWCVTAVLRKVDPLFVVAKNDLIGLCITSGLFLLVCHIFLIKDEQSRCVLSGKVKQPIVAHYPLGISVIRCSWASCVLFICRIFVCWLIEYWKVCCGSSLMQYVPSVPSALID